MLTVSSKTKNGNTVTYECKDDYGTVFKFNKDALIHEIRNNNVSNARIQDYKGQLIIRIKDNIPSVSTDGKEQKTRTKNSRTSKDLLAIDVFKKIIKDFNIQHEEEVLSMGFDKYELDLDVTNYNKKDLAELRYRMASDIKKIADIENNNKLAKYNKEYMALVITDGL